MSKEKQVAGNKKTNDKAKKPNFFVRAWRGLKKGLSNMWAELKKVAWPKLPTVVKQTGVVLGVVLVFLIVITAVDFGLGQALSWLTGLTK